MSCIKSRSVWLGQQWWRKDFLPQGLRFEVVPSWFKETLDKRLFSAPHEYAVETAKQKALEVAKRMPLVSKASELLIPHHLKLTLKGLHCVSLSTLETLEDTWYCDRSRHHSGEWILVLFLLYLTGVYIDSLVCDALFYSDSGWADSWETSGQARCLQDALKVYVCVCDM